MTSIFNENKSLGGGIKSFSWQEISLTRTLFIPVFVKVISGDESTTYQSKLRIRLIIVHICIRHTLTTITFKNDYTNDTKITVEIDLSCPDPTSFQMVFFSEVG